MSARSSCFTGLVPSARTGQTLLEFYNVYLLDTLSEVKDAFDAIVLLHCSRGQQAGASLAPLDSSLRARSLAHCKQLSCAGTTPTELRRRQRKFRTDELALIEKRYLFDPEQFQAGQLC